MTTADTQVTVEQADREAAWHIVKSYRPQDHGWLSRIASGEADSGEIVQTCARHRLAAEKRERAACAEVAERHPVNDPNERPVDQLTAEHLCEHAARIAAAILARAEPMDRHMSAQEVKPCDVLAQSVPLAVHRAAL